MACESIRSSREQTELQRKEEVKKKLKELEAKLRAKSVSLVIDPRTGAVTFRGWAVKDRGGVSDACAYRSLSAEGSWELRKAVAAAESQAGRKVSLNAVQGGTHSHDGGKTWGPGHGDE